MKGMIVITHFFNTMELKWEVPAFLVVPAQGPIHLMRAYQAKEQLKNLWKKLQDLDPAYQS